MIDNQKLRRQNILKLSENDCVINEMYTQLVYIIIFCEHFIKKYNCKRWIEDKKKFNQSIKF